MPLHSEVVAYSRKLLEHLKNYEYCNEDFDSRIVLLKRKDSKYENLIPGPEAGQSLKKKGKT
jgi:wyosine [tRNA(Phe)-imidazoG37] synthetase (radical SAM superfamily)